MHMWFKPTEILAMDANDYLVFLVGCSSPLRTLCRIEYQQVCENQLKKLNLVTDWHLLGLPDQDQNPLKQPKHQYFLYNYYYKMIYSSSSTSFSNGILSRDSLHATVGPFMLFLSFRVMSYLKVTHHPTCTRVKLYTGCKWYDRP